MSMMLLVLLGVWWVVLLHDQLVLVTMEYRVCLQELLFHIFVVTLILERILLEDRSSMHGVLVGFKSFKCILDAQYLFLWLLSSQLQIVNSFTWLLLAVLITQFIHSTLKLLHFLLNFLNLIFKISEFFIGNFVCHYLFEFFVKTLNLQLNICI